MTPKTIAEKEHFVIWTGELGVGGDAQITIDLKILSSCIKKKSIYLSYVEKFLIFLMSSFLNDPYT